MSPRRWRPHRAKRSRDWPCLIPQIDGAGVSFWSNKRILDAPPSCNRLELLVHRGGPKTAVDAGHEASCSVHTGRCGYYLNFCKSRPGHRSRNRAQLRGGLSDWRTHCDYSKGLCRWRPRLRLRAGIRRLGLRLVQGRQRELLPLRQRQSQLQRAHGLSIRGEHRQQDKPSRLVRGIWRPRDHICLWDQRSLPPSDVRISSKPTSRSRRPS
jgi:hypothetical protein